MSIKAGDKVRVKRADYHGIKFGAICEVANPDAWGGDVLVVGPLNGEYATLLEQAEGSQYIELADILPATQANKRSKS